jgi:predicted porin
MATGLQKGFLIISTIIFSGHLSAAEIYNKDGNKLDLYGKLDARHTFSSAAGKDGDQTYARLGFKGATNITENLTGFGQWEYNFQANNAESEGDKGNATRLGFAGLKFGKLGSLDYGRNYGIVYDVEAWTDMLPVFGGDSYTKVDNFMVKRANNLLTYRNRDFFGLVDGWNIGIQYQGKNDSASESSNGRNSVTQQNGDGFGLSSSYKFDSGVGLVAAYASSDRTQKQVEAGKTSYSEFASGNRAEVWSSAIKYDANQVYLAAMYAQTLNMTAYGNGGIAGKTKNVEITAQYQFESGLRPSLAYLQSKGENLNSFYGNNQDLVKYIDIGSYYYFNKNMSAYIDYKINLLDNNDFTRKNAISTNNVVGTGLTYQF